MKVITLSTKAVADLRTSLQKTYGDTFVEGLSNEEINRIGVVLLTGLVESLKLEIHSYTTKSK